MLPLRGGKTEQIIERTHPGASLAAGMQRTVCLENIYFIYTEKTYFYLTDDDMPSHQNAIFMGTALNPALICHLSFNFYSIHKAYDTNDTENVDRLPSITFHVVTANLLT